VATAPRAESAEVCPDFHAAIELIGKRWSGAILRTLCGGPLRFAELAKRIPGMSDRLLSERLKELEEAGLIDRDVPDDSPVRVVYRLTEKGGDLTPVLDGLGQWASRWKGGAAGAGPRSSS